MSRSNNTEIINPCKIYLEWQGSTGKFKYFDKSKGKKGEQVIVELPFTFLVLDKLSTIKGFSDADQSGFWSNEVRSTKTEPLTVRNKKGAIMTALYANLGPVLRLGACYSQSVYIAYFDENKELSIGNISIHGSAIGSWIDFCKGKDIYSNAIEVSGSTSAKKGATKYFVPVFKMKEVSPETENKAKDLDKQLQKYFSIYFNRDKKLDNLEPQRIDEDEILEPIDTFVGENTDQSPDDLPF